MYRYNGVEANIMLSTNNDREPTLSELSCYVFGSEVSTMMFCSGIQ